MQMRSISMGKIEMRNKMATKWQHNIKILKKVLQLGLSYFSGAIDGTRTHGITEPQSAELTNFSTTAICFVILLYFEDFINMVIFVLFLWNLK